MKGVPGAAMEGQGVDVQARLIAGGYVTSKSGDSGSVLSLGVSLPREGADGARALARPAHVRRSPGRVKWPVQEFRA